uniref:Uncharacterized protein n=1 Tax=Tanacetum cinerariifolium TaxID=118510 RepID=A0A6L2L0X3_TANCI|nr:hypothetical protein [Tanacetum cinerariifolium]
MLNLKNSNQDPSNDLYDLKGSDERVNEIDSLNKEPFDTLLMGDEGVKVTSVYDDLECDIPFNTPLPTTYVKEEDFDITSPLGEYVVDFLMENVDVADEMLNLKNSNQDPSNDLYDLKGSDEGVNEIDSLNKEPCDTLLMRDEVIGTNSKKKNIEFIKSSVDDLVPTPRESKVTSVCDDFECDIPFNTPLPTTYVREEDFDINSPLGEYVVDFLMENVDVADLPRHLVKQLFSHLVKNLSLTKRMFDDTFGHDSKPRSYDVTLSNPLFDYNDDFILCNDNLLFDEEFKGISSLDPLSRLQLLMSLPY